MILVRPRRKHLTFIFGSVDSGDLHDVLHAKLSQLTNLPRTRILLREPATDELMVHAARRIHKDRNSI